MASPSRRLHLLEVQPTGGHIGVNVWGVWEFDVLFGVEPGDVEGGEAIADADRRHVAVLGHAGHDDSEPAM